PFTKIVIEGCDCYEIRTVPSIITLKKGEVCEFEIFIKLLCLCKIDEHFVVIYLNLWRLFYSKPHMHGHRICFVWTFTGLDETQKV
ncbi:hypothetical protein EIN_024410, partial [Entamoeba invadens IP1]|uniref:hypothetical protein n=1 Tax=Entamoeba invadens IP1 TaxID=370355 RepID=UPI0002C3F590